MKRINIYYHMETPDDIAETCVTLSMLDDIAEDLLNYQNHSKHVAEYKNPALNGSVHKILVELSKIQGHTFNRFVMAENEVTARWQKNTFA